MSTDKNEILDKIKKLLRMKRGGTPGEVENALAMAAKLAQQHGIDIAAVDPDEQSESRRITHADQVLGLRMPLEAKFAAAILVNFFSVEVLLREGICAWWVKKPHTLTIIGTAWDIEIARYVFVFLQHHFRLSWRMRSNKRLRNRSAFLHGMYCGLRNKLNEERDASLPSGEGLILIGRALEERKSYLQRLCPTAKDAPLPDEDSEAWRSKMAGYVEGKKTEIRRGLEQSKAPARPALPPVVGQLSFL